MSNTSEHRSNRELIDVAYGRFQTLQRRRRLLTTLVGTTACGLFFGTVAPALFDRDSASTLTVASAGQASPTIPEPAGALPGEEDCRAAGDPAENPMSGLWTADPAGGQPLRIAEGEGSGFLAWSPNSEKIAFGQSNPPHRGVDVIDVRSRVRTTVFAPNTYEALRPTDRQYVGEVVWSPDGSKIAFAVYRGDLFEDLFVVRPDGSGLTHLADDNDFGAIPVWSPDGAWIAFSGSDDVAVIAADGSGRRNFTTAAEYHGYVSWSPDGSKLAFQDTDQLYTIRPDGSERTLVSPIAQRAVAPVWSPDGGSLAVVVGGREQDTRVEVVDATGGPGRVVSGPERMEYGQPQWSPDGKALLFTASPEEDFRSIVVADAESGDPRVLASCRYPDPPEAPAWSPVDDRIAYTDGDGIHVVNADGSSGSVIARAQAAPQWSSNGTALSYIVE